VITQSNKPVNTILVVDDEESIRSSLSGILSDEGFNVILAEDGKKALNVAGSESPDLVLLDIWMPGMDGMETLKKMKEEIPSLPVIMMSGHGTIETAVQATKLGAYDFIEKPFNKLTKLHKLMESYDHKHNPSSGAEVWKR